MFLGSDRVHVMIKALYYALTFSLDEIFEDQNIARVRVYVHA
jgi:predicted DNA-binding protein YlxM (UPF0122 family)